MNQRKNITMNISRNIIFNIFRFGYLLRHSIFFRAKHSELLAKLGFDREQISIEAPAISTPSYFSSTFLNLLSQQHSPNSDIELLKNESEKYTHLITEPVKKFSEYNKQQSEREAEYRFCYFVLNDERAHLYERINKRVDTMIKAGLESEVHQLLEKGYTPDLVSMQGVGYKELLAYFDGKETLEEAVETIKKNTRHFAKRQLTWFRKEENVIWVDKPAFNYDDDKILDFIYEHTKKIGIEKEA